MKGEIERRQHSMAMHTADNQQGVSEGKVKVGEDDLTLWQKTMGIRDKTRREGKGNERKGKWG